MNEITYHRATANDAAVLTELRIKFALELSGPQPQAAIDALKVQMTGYFKEATATDKCISYIARCNGEAAGIGSVQLREQPGNFKNPSGRWGYIMNMYTLPQHRRKGICSSILRELVADASRMGITAFELHATKTGEPVYAQLGFSVHNEPTYRMYV
jgi:ribosomal protein S18 acetylase RimI-like enzyme